MAKMGYSRPKLQYLAYWVLELQDPECGGVLFSLGEASPKWSQKVGMAHALFLGLEALGESGEVDRNDSGKKAARKAALYRA